MIGGGIITNEARCNHLLIHISDAQHGLSVYDDVITDRNLLAAAVAILDCLESHLKDKLPK